MAYQPPGQPPATPQGATDRLPEPPAESHYRQAEPDADQACATCQFFAAEPSETADGTCRFWDANVLTDYVCDDWEQNDGGQQSLLSEDEPHDAWRPEPPPSPLQAAQDARRRRVTR